MSDIDILQKNVLNSLRKIYNLGDIKDISYDFIKQISLKMDRNSAVLQINKYLNNMILSSELEKGIFESVIRQYLKIQHHNLVPAYLMKLHTICENLDTNNTSIDNQTLKYAILTGKIKAKIVPFLSPQQLHPKKWLLYEQKKSRETNAIRNMRKYKDVENPCTNCGAIEFHTYEQQLRSADEPPNKFMICADCGSTTIL